MEIRLSGHWAWIVPLCVIILAGLFAVWLSCPIQEAFEDAIIERLEMDEKAKSEKKNGKKDDSKHKNHQDEDKEKDEDEDEDKESEDKEESEHKDTKKKSKKDHKETFGSGRFRRYGSERDERDDELADFAPALKEGYLDWPETSVQNLQKGWRFRSLPRTMQAYYGPVLGWNCGEYSEFQFNNNLPTCFRDQADSIVNTVPSKFCPTGAPSGQGAPIPPFNGGVCGQRCFVDSGCPGDYIFPGSAPLKSDLSQSLPEMGAKCGGRPRYARPEQGHLRNTARQHPRCPTGMVPQWQSQLGPVMQKLDATDVDTVMRPVYENHRGKGNENPVMGSGRRY